MASVKANIGKDGKIVSYRFRCCIGRDDMGRQKFATKTVHPAEGLTPKKLEKEMQRLADEWEAGILAGIVPIENNTFEDFINNTWWPVHVMDGTHKPSTIEFYKNLLPRIIKSLGKCKLSSIKPLDIEKFLNSLRTEGLSAKTCRHYQVLLGTIFNFAECHDLIVKNPMRRITPVKLEKKPVDFLSPTDAKIFIDSLENVSTVWRCMMTVFILCGLRRGEALGLQWKDIDFKSKQLHIERNVTYTPINGLTVSAPKTENSIRVLPISAPVLNTLMQWKKEQVENFRATLLPTAYIFSSAANAYQPMAPSNPTRWLEHHCKKYNLPDVSPHDLRHTCGALMLASGASVKEVQDFLGHSDPATTLKFYAGTTPDMLRTASDGLANVLYGS